MKTTLPMGRPAPVTGFTTALRCAVPPMATFAVVVDRTVREGAGVAADLDYPEQRLRQESGLLEGVEMPEPSMVAAAAAIATTAKRR